MLLAAIDWGVGCQSAVTADHVLGSNPSGTARSRPDRGSRERPEGSLASVQPFARAQGKDFENPNAKRKGARAAQSAAGRTPLRVLPRSFVPRAPSAPLSNGT